MLQRRVTALSFMSKMKTVQERISGGAARVDRVAGGLPMSECGIWEVPVPGGIPHDTELLSLQIRDGSKAVKKGGSTRPK